MLLGGRREGGCEVGDGMWVGGFEGGNYKGEEIRSRVIYLSIWLVIRTLL